ncbi:ABC transporter substrate-binding protein [Cellulomonas aerilata]|uniref:Putative D,D-dipeptide-binding periplasmic protein DdpA n=1 Tax=Cellulomonas aerilata TaxID=515326 RepID=A0A512DCE8_9CELL|nr:ABC transporter substrate-binding protein [Cellulomonas aerilata]GEO34097.1 putative D,D-dipeptide-binding periplasmic protein DdpA [Cellulomonas aerilata]
MTPTPGRRGRPRATRATRLLVPAVATTFLLAACSGGAGGGGGETAAPSSAPTDGVLHLGLLNDIGQPPDPDIYYSGNGLALTTNLYEGLVRYEPGNHEEAAIVPSLATEWQANEDSTVWTFTLRDGVTFHDGTPFTSAAVQASFQRRLDVGGGPAYMAEGIASFETPDDRTVVITLEEPNSAFLDSLASPYGPRMISPTVLTEEAGDDFAQTYLSTASAGTGPYRLTEARVDEVYEMEAFEDYWGEEPTFTTVEFPVYTDTSAMQLALDNGDLAGIIGAVPSAAQAGYVEEGVLDTYSLPTFQVGVLYMNPHRDFLATSEARTALFEAVDWASVVEQVLGEKSELATGAYSRGALPDGQDTKEIRHDPAPLAEYVGTLPEGTEVEIGHAAGSADDAQIANLVAAQLQGLGLAATVTEFQTSEVFGSFAGDPANAAPDVYVASGTWPDANNPYLYGHVFWDEGGGLNFLQCTDDDATAALAEGLRTGDPAAYVAAGEAITEAMCTPTFAYTNDFVVTQPWLGNVEESHTMAEPYALDFNTLTIVDE